MNEYDMQEQNGRNDNNREDYDRRTRNMMDMRMGTDSMQGSMNIGNIKTNNSERTRRIGFEY